MAAVELKSIGKSYDGKTSVIPSVDLSIQHGEFVVLVGPSGCGKSTLLRMIAGLETISSGEVLIDGKCINHEPPRNRDVAMVFQDYALYPHKSLYENMAFGLRLRKTPEAQIKQRVMESATLLKIEHLLERKPAALSGGQRQRVAIGRAIVRQPKVFLFDEPLSNLDAQLRAEMRSEIKKLHKRLGATIIYVTHDQVEAMTLADRIAVFKSGINEQYGTPDQVYNQPASMFVASFMGSPAMNLAPIATLPPVLQALAPQGINKEITVGIRPENLCLQAQSEGSVAVRAEVILCEPLGAETLVTVRIGQAEWIARLPMSFAVNMGESLDLFMSKEKFHFFNTTTGAKI